MNQQARKPHKKHDYPVRYDKPSEFPQSYILAETANNNIPTAAECQAMIIAARKAHRLTQGAFAHILGLSWRNVHHWEHGRPPNEAARRRIGEVCRALGVA